MVMTYLNFLFSITSLDTGCFRFIYLFICNKNVLTTASQWLPQNGDAVDVFSSRSPRRRQGVLVGKNKFTGATSTLTLTTSGSGHAKPKQQLP